MNILLKIPAVVLLGLATISAPTIAHHSFAMFDQSKVTTLKNVKVAEFRWGNPHVFLIVESGGKRYALECSSPSALGSSGWKFNTVKVGDTINVDYFPLRNGKAGGALKVVTLASGKQFPGI